MNKKVLGIAVIFVAAVGGTVAVKSLLNDSSGSSISENAWKSIEIPRLGRVSLPGEPKKSTQNLGGVTFTIHTLDVSKDLTFMVGYSISPLEASRRMLAPQVLLNDACNGAVKSAASEGAVEVSRKFITMGNHPGMKLVLDVPKGKGQMLMQMYFVKGQFVMLLIGGRGITESSPDAVKFFESLVIADLGAPPGTYTTEKKATPPKTTAAPKQPEKAAAKPVESLAEKPAPPKKPEPQPLRYTPPPAPELPAFTNAKISKPASIPLPEPAQRALLAGGGKYLVVSQPKSSTLAIIDLDQRKIARTIALGAVGPILLATTAKHVIVLDQKAKAITRYKLESGESDGGSTDTVQSLGGISCFTAGHSSDGPLGIGSIHFGMNFYNTDGTGPAFPQRTFDRSKFAASASGRTFLGVIMTAKGTQLSEIAFRDGGVVQTKQEVPSTSLAVPGPDDEHLYANGVGISLSGFKEANNVPASLLTAKSTSPEHAYLPAASGQYYMQATALGKPGNAIGTVRIYRHGIDKPIQTLNNLPMARVSEFKKPGMIPFEETVHLVPRGGVLALIPLDRKEIKLYPVMLRTDVSD